MEGIEDEEVGVECLRSMLRRTQHMELRCWVLCQMQQFGLTSGVNIDSLYVPFSMAIRMRCCLSAACGLIWRWDVTVDVVEELS